MRFEFFAPTRIIVGAGAVNDVGVLSRELGRRPLIVCGRSRRGADRLTSLLVAAGCEPPPVVSIAGEPDLADVRRGAGVARAAHCDVVVAIGGGSAIDAAKGIAAIAANDGDVLDYLEIIGRNLPLARAPLPSIAIPTTAGAGCEVTRNAVLISREHQVKVSLRSPLMSPRIAVVDPDLTIGLPPAITAATGADALTQLVEAYLSKRANPMTDALCVDGMHRAARSLRTVFHEPGNRGAREDMAIASLFSGLALANAGLGAVHGFAAPIGGLFDAPHGAVCAALLPHVVARNLAAMRARGSDAAALARFDDVARILTDRPAATAADGVRWIADLVKELGIPGLGAYGVGKEHVDDLVARASRASSMKGNPVELTRAELAGLLTDAA